MDYSYDSCMNNFTAQQVRRMRCALQTYRSELYTSGGGGGGGAYSSYIPHITPSSTGWVETLVADNDSSSAATFTVTLYNEGAQVYSSQHTVNGLDQTSLGLKDLAANAEVGVVSYDDANLKFRLGYQANTGGVAEFLLTDTKLATMGLYFSGYSTTMSWKGMAIANFGSSDASITLYAVGGGSTLGTATVTVPAKDRISGTADSYFTNVLPSGIEKIIAVSSSAELAGIVISGSTTLDKLLFSLGTATSYSGGSGGGGGGGTSLDGTSWAGVWDWDCDGDTNWACTLTLAAGGTFTDTDGDSGTWSLSGSTVTIYYPSYDLTITGTVSGSSISGTMTDDGVTGCWTATKSSSRETAATMPAGGKGKSIN